MDTSADLATTSPAAAAPPPPPPPPESPSSKASESDNEAATFASSPYEHTRDIREFCRRYSKGSPPKGDFEYYVMGSVEAEKQMASYKKSKTIDEGECSYGEQIPVRIAEHLATTAMAEVEYPGFWVPVCFQNTKQRPTTGIIAKAISALGITLLDLVWVRVQDPKKLSKGPESRCYLHAVQDMPEEGSKIKRRLARSMLRLDAKCIKAAFENSFAKGDKPLKGAALQHSRHMTRRVWMRTNNKALPVHLRNEKPTAAAVPTVSLPLFVSESLFKSKIPPTKPHYVDDKVSVAFGIDSPARAKAWAAAAAPADASSEAEGSPSAPPSPVGVADPSRTPKRARPRPPLPKKKARRNAVDGFLMDFKSDCTTELTDELKAQINGFEESDEFDDAKAFRMEDAVKGVQLCCRYASAYPSDLTGEERTSEAQQFAQLARWYASVQKENTQKRRKGSLPDVAAFDYAVDKFNIKEFINVTKSPFLMVAMTQLFGHNQDVLDQTQHAEATLAEGYFQVHSKVHPDLDPPQLVVPPSSSSAAAAAAAAADAGGDDDDDATADDEPEAPPTKAQLKKEKKADEDFEGEKEEEEEPEPPSSEEEEPPSSDDEAEGKRKRKATKKKKKGKRAPSSKADAPKLKKKRKAPAKAGTKEAEDEGGDVPAAEEEDAAEAAAPPPPKKKARKSKGKSSKATTVAEAEAQASESAIEEAIKAVAPRPEAASAKKASAPTDPENTTADASDGMFSQAAPPDESDDIKDRARAEVDKATTAAAASAAAVVVAASTAIDTEAALKTPPPPVKMADSSGATSINKEEEDAEAPSQAY